ncbi:MAG: ABC transporter ATP-binding protein [Actinomycetaceae bacterium]|nr:ABC transporter ATP-binding protein [Actinomycetaceae bacterium]
MRESLSNKSESQFVLECEGLEKRFGSVRALDGLDLSVAEGQIHGFLGPNGAGKTTTIRAILGQIHLDAGSIRVFGLDPIDSIVDVHRRLAYVPGDTSLWPGLTGGECIDLLGRLHGRQDSKRREALVELFELDPTRRTRTYSKGNRQKVALIAALACRADLLLLDEPTSGLDPVMTDRFLQAVRQARDEGATVVLSSHIMSEVEALCDAVTIVASGKVAYSGSLRELAGSAHVTIEAEVPGGQGAVRREVAPGEVDAIVAELLAAGASIKRVEHASLEQIFLGYYREEK